MVPIVRGKNLICPSPCVTLCYISNFIKFSLKIARYTWRKGPFAQRMRDIGEPRPARALVEHGLDTEQPGPGDNVYFPLTVCAYPSGNVGAQIVPPGLGATAPVP
jgi:hypothetical protein